MTTKKVQPRRVRGKAAYDRAADELTAERIRAILSDPKVPRRVKSKLDKLTYKLYADTNAFSEVTPDSCAANFIDGAVALSGAPDDDARAVYDEIVKLTEANEPEEYKVARRVAEIYAAEISRPGEGEGWKLIVEAADEMTTEGDEGVMLSSPLSEFFVAFFVKAVRERGRAHHAYVAVKELIARVDAGEDLDRIAADEKRQKEERHAEYEAEQRAKPEPKDKLSHEWRYWKLRQVEAGFDGKGTKNYVRAWEEFNWFLKDYSTEFHRQNTSNARQLLPVLIIAWQEAQKLTKKGKAKTARKGGAR